MTIQFQCSGCQATLQVKDELAGKEGKCPHCGTNVLIPSGQSSGVMLDATFLNEATTSDMLRELRRRKQSAVLVVFNTPASGSYEQSSLLSGGVRCVGTDDMQDAQLRKVLEEVLHLSVGKNSSTADSPVAGDGLYDFKGDKVGMGLEEFKRKHSRKVEWQNVDLPWCSDRSRGQRIEALLSEEWHAEAGIVHARIELPYEQRRPTIAGVPTDLLLYQFVDEQLARISLKFDTDSSHIVRDALTKKYGAPTSQKENPKQIIWSSTKSAIQLLPGRIYPPEPSWLHVVHSELQQLMDEREPKHTDDL